MLAFAVVLLLWVMCGIQTVRERMWTDIRSPEDGRIRISTMPLRKFGPILFFSIIYRPFTGSKVLSKLK